MQILAIDIGNTSTSCALVSGRKISRRFSVPTHGLREGGAAAIQKKFRQAKAEATVIASVVPDAGKFLRKELTIKKRPAMLVGRDISVPIVNRYRDPRKVGIDRLMNALAAHYFYGGPLIIIDFGTAVTFDAVSKKGDYLGGVIAPGIEISLEALFSRTALLPKIRLKSPREIIGRDTVESIRIGCSVGIGGLCDRIVHKLLETKELRKSKIIATGGYALFMKRYCESIDKIEAGLVMQGIYLAYQSSL